MLASTLTMLQLATQSGCKHFVAHASFIGQFHPNLKPTLFIDRKPETCKTWNSSLSSPGTSCSFCTGEENVERAHYAANDETQNHTVPGTHDKEIRNLKL